MHKDTLTHKQWNKQTVKYTDTGLQILRYTETKRHMQHANGHGGRRTLSHKETEEHRYWNIHRHQDTQTVEHTIIRK